MCRVGLLIERVKIKSVFGTPKRPIFFGSFAILNTKKFQSRNKNLQTDEFGFGDCSFRD